MRSSLGRQQGLVLVLALVVLAALSLAAVGLMRGVLGSNRVAGNLAYQQAAVQAADGGVETALAWLEQLSTEKLAGATPGAPPVDANRLYGNLSKADGSRFNYVATRADPGVTQTWEGFWQTLAAASQVNDLAADAAGNRVSFVIHRLCANAGPPKDSVCETSPALATSQNNSRGGNEQVNGLGQVYYRITVRVQGPRNATSFIQVVAAI
ncbi:PilX N-terminal domain-containing pilus assembly protein [Pelomonas sp. UHG3]|jgi:Tfp pilus assembly protein PilX|uniref:PilX N-terminal domain-containing pilus assembly protein n=1 Tax=Roseateles hydrophilus TaxID=2975054 RepID=A0ACC6CB65_9BURK|nr:PilX N-terminal domain-containing pilus assembly protein [Pelomonas sp. UHG3]MCY4745620.1 PilX N-terminal domain-containing pilus assembly protein [Pelomonas sp. UHG3]